MMRSRRSRGKGAGTFGVLDVCDFCTTDIQDNLKVTCCGAGRGRSAVGSKWRENPADNNNN
jgi:hypothetical protein